MEYDVYDLLTCNKHRKDDDPVYNSPVSVKDWEPMHQGRNEVGIIPIDVTVSEDGTIGGISNHRKDAKKGAACSLKIYECSSSRFPAQQAHRL